jgi:hypothetical protein
MSRSLKIPAAAIPHHAMITEANAALPHTQLSPPHCALGRDPRIYWPIETDAGLTSRSAAV